MSRIGRLPVAIPAGVDVTINGREVSVRGPKGQLSLKVAEPIEVKQADGVITVSRPNDEDRKSTRLNSSHTVISYAVFCLKKKNRRRQLGSGATGDSDGGGPGAAEETRGRI